MRKNIYNQNLLALLVATIFILMVATPSMSEEIPDIKAFVHTKYNQGIPFEFAAQLDRKCVPVLITMLKDPSEKVWWGNIVGILAALGDERAVEPLVHFVEQDIKGEIDASLLSVLLGVYPALGHIANAGSEQALDRLISGTSLTYWQNKKLSWQMVGLKGKGVYLTFMKSSVIGLGIAAQPRAIETLKKIQSDAATPPELKAIIPEALETSAKVKRVGRLQLYGTSHK